MPPICGTVTWLSSTKTSALSGRYSNRVGGGSPGLAAGEVARIVLDAGAGAGGLHHLEVEVGALLQPLRLQQPALRASSSSSRWRSSSLMPLDRLLQRRARRDVVGVGVDLDLLRARRSSAPVSGSNSAIDFDLVAEEARCARRGPRSGPGRSRWCRRARGRCRARSRLVVALVLQRHELGDQLALVDALRPPSASKVIAE